MNVRKPYDARTGARVTLMVSRGPIELRVAEKLMENGRVGDEVRVENTHTHTVIRSTGCIQRCSDPARDWASSGRSPD